MLNLNSFLIFSHQATVLTEFYQKVFDIEPDWSGGDFKGFTVGSCAIAIGPHDKITGNNTQPERMMFNLETEDVKGEFDRIKNLGALVIKEPYQPSEDTSMWIATFADPDGNYFQIASPMKA